MNEQLVRLRGAKSEAELIGQDRCGNPSDLLGSFVSGRGSSGDRVGPRDSRSGLARSGRRRKAGHLSLQQDPASRRGRQGHRHRRRDVPTRGAATRRWRASDPVAQASEIITKGFDKPLEIKQIANRVGLSVSQLNRRFRAVYQMTPRSTCSAFVFMRRSIACRNRLHDR